ncbi:uncharacterized protein SPSC_00156 [Sporisorium scitamineum]|nr:uncharacterized protein SPSC_00156 [Sporisorium scitamineum]
MIAETQQPQGADPPQFDPSQPPPSSPIDGFGSPSLLTLPPPVDRSTRSQSSTNPPRLDLISYSAMSQVQSICSSTMRLRKPTEEEEVDELDEFDADAPNELDFELCDKLEAESLRTASQRREQSVSANSTGVGGSGSTRTSQKRTRTPSILNNQVIDLRDTSPELSTQLHKRFKTQKRGDDGEPIKPYFEKDWVKDLLAKSNGVRAFSPLETAGPLSGGREPQQSPASQAARNINGRTAAQGRPASQHNVVKEGSSSSNVTAFRTTGSGSNSSSDGDIPLAAPLIASMAVLDQTGPRQKAITKVVKAVAELNGAYEHEVESMKMKLMERDVVIDALRAQLRKRPSK